MMGARFSDDEITGRARLSESNRLLLDLWEGVTVPEKRKELGGEDVGGTSLAKQYLELKGVKSYLERAGILSIVKVSKVLVDRNESEAEDNSAKDLLKFMD